MYAIKSVVKGKVAVRREEPRAVSEGGIILPSRSREKSAYAQVVALPRGYTGPLAVGDRVLLEWFAGTPVELDAACRVFVCREEDVLAVER